MLIVYGQGDRFILFFPKSKTHNPEKRLTILYHIVYVMCCIVYQRGVASFLPGFFSRSSFPFATFTSSHRTHSTRNLDIPNPIKIITRIDNFALYYIAIWTFNKFLLSCLTPPNDGTRCDCRIEKHL